METERFTEALTARAKDRRRSTSEKEREWKNGYVDGAASILAEVDALIKRHKEDALPYIKRYINKFNSHIVTLEQNDSKEQ